MNSNDDWWIERDRQERESTWHNRHNVDSGADAGLDVEPQSAADDDAACLLLFIVGGALCLWLFL